MTVNSIESAKVLVDELLEHHPVIHSVWEYSTGGVNHKLYAVFIHERYCDIYESPYVLKPVRIYKYGKWLLPYEYLNTEN